MNPRQILIADDVDTQINFSIERDMRVTLLIPFPTHWQLEAFEPVLRKSNFAARVGSTNIYIPPRQVKTEAVEVIIEQALISQILEGRELWERSDETREVEVCVRLLSHS